MEMYELKTTLLTIKPKEKRLQWTKENINRDFFNIIYSDEIFFWTWIYSTRGRYNPSFNARLNIL